MGKYITLNHLDQTVWSLLQKIDAKTDDRISDEDITKWNSPISYNSLTNKPYIPTSQDIINGAEYTVLHGNYPVSTFQNDMGYLTSYAETDPTVPSWAKASSKPTYTAAEVGALPDTTVIPEDKIFIATYGTTSYADTLAAYNAGKLIFGVYNPNSSNGPGKLIIPLTSYSSAQFQFEGKYLLGRSELEALYLQPSGWSVSIFFGDITNRSADIESGDSLIIRDVSGGYTNKYSTLTFGTSTNQYLANNGTWQTLPDIAGFSVSVVQTLPAENIDDHTIYFLSNNGDSGNVYDEYMYVNNTWEMIGSTEVDLSNYLQKTEIADWAKAATKPTYTASEVGAVPITAGTTNYSSITNDYSGITLLSNAVHNDEDWNMSLTITPNTITFTEFGDRIGSNDKLIIGNSVTIHDVVTPTANGDAANKQYVDNKVSSLTAADVGALPSSTVIPTVPTNVSDFINDAGYLTSYTETDPVFAASAASGITDADITNWNNKLSSYTETDPTVPAWAKASSKPTYTAAEVGALSDTTKYVSDVILVNHGEDLRVKYSDGTYQNVLQISSHIHNTLQTTAGSNNTEYNLIGTETSNANNTAVNIYNPGSISFAKTANEARLTLGSSSLPGKLRLYSSTNSASGFTDLISGASSTNERTITLPDATGTVALTSDIPNVPSWALAANKPTYTAAEVGATTSSDVSGMISSAVSGITSFSMEIVSSLPATGVAGRIYFVTGNNNTNDIYEEYIYVNNNWEKLGNFDATNVDLSGYLQTGDIAAWAKAANKPSYTASEVGALPSNTTYVSSFNGESGAITYIPPVTSVNGQTGAVTTTDEKLSTAAQNSTGNVMYILTGPHNATASTKYYAADLWFGQNSSANSAALHIGGSSSGKGKIQFVRSKNTPSIQTSLVCGEPSSNNTVTLPISSGTLALTSDIPTTASDVGALADDCAAAGITSTDISNWNALVSDDKTWNGVALTITETQSNGAQYIPVFQNKQLSGNASMLTATSTPTAYKITKYDANAYLKSTTPASGDNSTKVATTAYVDTAISGISIPQRYNASTNPTGYLTINDLPIYDGTVI